MTNPLARDLDSVLEQTAPLWNDLRGARLFITGGTGFFGCWLLETLLWANARLHLGAAAVVLTRDPARFARVTPHLALADEVVLQSGDVRSFDFPPGTFTHVIHAAVDHAAAADSGARLREFETTLQGTARTLEFARRSRATRFLLTSSGSVYGRQPADLTHVSETYPGAPDSTSPSMAGAEAKRGAEMLTVLNAERDFAPTIARCFAFVGPYLPLDGKFAVGNFIRDALRGGAVRVSGDGTPYRSYLYAGDLAAWLWTILIKGASGRVYNVGSEQQISIADLARAVVRALGVSAAIDIARVPTEPVRERYVPSTARVREELGVRETVGLEDALRRTADWHRDSAALLRS